MKSKTSAGLRALALGLIAAGLLSGCNQQASSGKTAGTPSAATAISPSNAPIDQANLCEVNHYGLASACKPGQKIVFLPQSFGNEQLPILFVAINCDLRYTVALTKGGVSCIYGPITPAAREEAPPAASSSPASAAAAQP